MRCHDVVDAGRVALVCEGAESGFEEEVVVVLLCKCRQVAAGDDLQDIALLERPAFHVLALRYQSAEVLLYEIFARVAEDKHACFFASVELFILHTRLIVISTRRLKYGPSPSFLLFVGDPYGLERDRWNLAFLLSPGFLFLIWKQLCV